jgi:hypothetical protein
MGHCISVYLINKSELRNDKIDSVIDGKITDSDIIWTELKSGILATPYIPNIREYGKDKIIAKIETDYFGGGGDQSAKLFINNKKEYDKDDSRSQEEPINTVLRMMGIVAKPEMDEFDTIGLGSYRHNGDFNK